MKRRCYPNTDEWRYGQFLREKCEIYEFEVKEAIKEAMKI